MIFRSLYARLASVLVLVLLVVGTIYALLTISITQNYTRELTQQFNRDIAKNIISDRNLIDGGELDAKALKATFSAYMGINPSIEIYLLDPQGVIKAFSADPEVVKRKRVSLQPIQAFLRGEGFPLLGDDPRSHDRMKAFSVTPIPMMEGPPGYLYVVLRGEQYDNAAKAIQESYALKLGIWAVSGSLGFGLFAGLLLFYRLTRRLQRLSNVIDDFQGSEFTKQLSYAVADEIHHDELDRLGVAFNEMSARIVSLLAQLKDQDRLRREFVAQISHDLRTPLAVLHGYIESLSMKRDAVDASERDRYLDTALRQSETLKRMVEELFELAHLEAREAELRLERISIAELVQDIVQKFQVEADKQGVSLVMAEPESLSMVEADVALIERALDNLINNAIEHTPDQGRVTLTVTESVQKIMVGVKDTGPGIPEDDLPHLFDAFYQGGSQLGKRGHAGLGLAIAQRIARLHQGDLKVENMDPDGASFTLLLPIQI